LGPLWVLSAALATAIVTAAALHRTPTFISWSITCTCAAIIATAIYLYVGKDPVPPSNSPVALYAVFIAAPTLATFGIERAWFRLGRAVRRPLATIALSVPLAVLIYWFSFVVALSLAVGIGLVRP
jgi:hypothetical protein